MNNAMVIGQYVPGNSLVHRLDPRTKITIIFIFVFIVFLANNIWSYTILTIFALTSMLTSRVPLKFVLKGLMPVWFLIIFTFILHLIITKEGTVIFEVFAFQVYSGGLIQGFAISMRFFLLILVTSLLTLTTTPIEITDAIESILQPLKKVRFPVHELALMMSISLRFIPTLLQETEKISKAQASRGVDFRTGKIKDRIQAVVPLLVPLFVSAFKRAEELAMAMEARGYQGGEGRTKLRELKLSKLDVWIYLLFVIVIIGLLITRN
ncbi:MULTISPECIES: energy-coupling factor transporter transmembrane component T family protein [Virgibacillus]|uniref:Energy-coupling factor transporter transmembrane protein EcfT n=1 Tax=Virgibacillus pantothenticus TaxID=1473 RepID=A0A0L0QVU7_VIRPA|nr:MULTISPECIES: energy-coupling factor transporter transmembrane protein EcfT [Virgibacillus]API92401.1 transporter [Virgibacillus sp. 6R]KNE22652.1 transporter [Virgibacillus pantothenticus]MBS7427359.1 energy-coupling factor transporter transmembrane protein EcfT [Virgibacillus sp. 19R1-5]MBU8566987.1 energy-coupling factor transporter transmembrane protein EcfT [Virgibacillus pantothenticus]MBU8602563.1 energy-coupling factor transporter transmembrane protein EcfT [Virgibacillus pantothent